MKEQNKDIILELNKSFSKQKITDNDIIITNRKELSILECSDDILTYVLNYFDGVNNLSYIKGELAKKYSVNDVDLFIDTLIKQKILIEKDCIKCDYHIKLCIIGDGLLSSCAKDVINDDKTIELDIVSFKNFTPNCSFDYDMFLLIPEESTYGDIKYLNKLLVEKEKPFLLMYCDGEKIVIGPHVFPYKTTCFNCHCVHHVLALSRNLKRTMNFEDINNLNLSFPMPNTFSKFKVYNALELVVNEIKKLKHLNSSLEFACYEKSISENQNDFIDIKKYRPITDCVACHGLNKKFKIFTSNLDIPEMERMVTPGEDIQYNSGGFRSRTYDETLFLINTAINNIGADIDIKLMENNPFKSFLPVYDSIMTKSHFNKTPFFLEDKMSHGKGMSKEQAYFSACFELVERISSRYYGDCEIIRATINEVQEEHVMDIETFIKHNQNPYSSYETFDKNSQLDWVWGQSILTNKPKLMLASLVFLQGGVFRGKFFNESSSGLSAGATLNDAILQGLLELVEHDAWIIGQSNNIQLPLIDISDLRNKKLKNVIKDIENLGYKIILRDYTNDIGVPVIRAWIVNPKNPTIYANSGVGASLSIEIAIERAITEAVQSASFIPNSKSEGKFYSTINMADLSYSRDSLHALFYFKQKDINIDSATKIKSLSDFPVFDFNSVEEIIQLLVSKIVRAIPNADILVYNLTKESIGIPVVRTVITGDIQRLSIPLITVSPRLFNFQVNMGYSTDIPKYEDLYMGPYPH